MSGCFADQQIWTVGLSGAALIGRWRISSLHLGSHCQHAAMVRSLTAAALRDLLGPTRPARLGGVDVLDETEVHGHVRRTVSYEVPSGRASTSVSIPVGLTEPVPRHLLPPPARRRVR